MKGNSQTFRQALKFEKSLRVSSKGLRRLKGVKKNPI
jgi:uncharacterized protein YjbI with pentapeptide repeats